MSKYVFYLHGLAGLTTDAVLQDDEAAAYAIGSLDRLHKVKLPRCRKEVEDAIAALSDPTKAGTGQPRQTLREMRAAMGR